MTFSSAFARGKVALVDQIGAPSRTDELAKKNLPSKLEDRVYVVNFAIGHCEASGGSITC